MGYITELIESNESRKVNTTMAVKSTKDEICEDCAKEDVCSIKEELTKAYKDILDIEDRKNVFISTSVKCKKFLRKPQINNMR